MSFGRPRKTEILPVFHERRQRWMLDVPASLAGKRRIVFFKDRHSALLEAARVEEQVSGGQQVVVSGRVTTLTVSKLAAAYLAEKELETGGDNIVTLRWGLKLLVGRFGNRDVQDLTAVEVDLWLKGLKQADGSPYRSRTRFGVFASCRTFFNSPMMKHLVPVNPFTNPPAKRDKGSRLAILTPEQMSALLAAPLADFFRAWIVAGGFGGMRTCEYERVSYESIDWENKEIIIRKDQSKQGKASRPRSISILPAFERHMPRGSGPLESVTRWKLEDQEMSVALEVLGCKEWPRNCLRHSFASYHLAHFRDASKTAYEMGSSASLIYSDYANAVSRKDAEAWWGL